MLALSTRRFGQALYLDRMAASLAPELGVILHHRYIRVWGKLAEFHVRTIWFALLLGSGTARFCQMTPLAAAILGPFLCVFCCFVVRNEDDMPSLRCEAEWHKKVGVSSVFCSYSISSFSILYSTLSAPILLSIAFISSVLTSSLLLASTHQ